MKTACLTARQRAQLCEADVPVPAFAWAALWTFLLLAALAEPSAPTDSAAQHAGAAARSAEPPRPQPSARDGLGA